MVSTACPLVCVTSGDSRSMAAMALFGLRALQLPSASKLRLTLLTRLRAALPLVGFVLAPQGEVRAVTPAAAAGRGW